MGDSTGIVDDKSGIQLANLALAEGFISADQWSEALAVQSREYAENKPARSLTAILEALGYLRPEQIDELRAKMRGRRPEADVGAKELGAPDAGKFGKFLVVRKRGPGPQGKVYEAHDPERKRKLALKIIRRSHDSDPEEIARGQECFLREGRKIAALPAHPHVVPVFETGIIRGKRYLAAELVEGRSWKDWARGDRSLFEILIVLRDAARAVQHAHEHGLIHGRLKPENILVDLADQARLTDVGLARAVRHDPRAILTATRMHAETASYLSPEQGQGNAAVDARADVYALGALLYEVLAGEPPFMADTPVQTLLRASTERPPRPAALARGRGLAGVDPDLERIALKAMARYPDDRFPTAEAFADELTRWLGGRRGGFLEHHRTEIIVGTIIAAALGGLAAYLLLS